MFPAQSRVRPITVAIGIAALAVGITGAFAAPPQAAHAAGVIVVDSTSQALGQPGCTLPEAILAANHDSSWVPLPMANGLNFETECAAGDGTDTIMLDGDATYAFSAPIDDAFNHVGPTATPIITSHIVIEGAGAVIQRSGGASLRAFAVLDGGYLDLRNVHVKGFAVKGGNGAGGGGGGLGAGGAIYVHDSTLIVQQSTFQSNVATGGNGSASFGGAGGGGGGLGGDGGVQPYPAGDANHMGGGGGGSRGDGQSPLNDFYGHPPGRGGGTVQDGEDGGYRCGGAGGDGGPLLTSDDGDDGQCPGGGGGGGGPYQGLVVFSGDGGDGAYGGGGGGGGYDTGDGGHGGFGGGGGSGPAFGLPDDEWEGGSGGDGGFGGGGGSGPGGVFFGDPGDGGTFAGNAGNHHGGGGAGLGGAIFGHASEILIVNSTFMGNAAVRGVAGGSEGRNGADAGGAIFLVAGELGINSSTIAGNESTGDGAGVVAYKPTTGDATTLSMYNTIVAGNTGHDECFVLGGVTKVGANNLVTPHPLDDTRTECAGITQTDDPQLSALADNPPGLTPTMAISWTSPAIDAADPDTSPLDDQRGVNRPQFAGPDIGAYELGLSSDTTPPTAPAPSLAPAANGDGWNTADVVVTWNWSDDESGVDSTDCTPSTTSSGEGDAIEVTATCTDLAGNEGSASVFVKVDKTAPTVTCDAPPSFVVGSTPTGGPSATVTDELSGPVASPVSATLGVTDVDETGVFSMPLTGWDVAGNSTTVDCDYVVGYDVSDFLQPIPQTSYKRGSTIPVKFQLADGSGLLSDASARALLSPTCHVFVTLDGQVKGCATYNATTDTFQFDIKTAKSISAGLHTVGVRITSADGEVVNTDSTQVRLR
ncbi:choice-of-anchor Q domain-containing protein [Agromyces aurantiacus]|uniref:Choice-of-anchor Q domain-containing protein n=1 Tax=Agromyces aurantiacus TaxID=165814 RepID=A0ABV9R2B1_9MICO|nr:choice-of-anchor Q domain-containing protein [Agromyces aurantiacus]MBM7505889.1 methionine-rich copper-binding protein CopC [Agromyces aurantiacus]